MIKNHNVLVIADTNATLTEEEHNTILRAMAREFDDVIDAGGMIGMIAGAETLRAAAEQSRNKNTGTALAWFWLPHCTISNGASG